MKSAEFRICFVLFSVLCLTLAGCGGGQPSDQPDLGTVSGTVTMDGNPLSGAMVVFSPEQGRSSMGLTDEAGNYDLIYVGDTHGAKLGKHKISITTAPPEGSEETVTDENAPQPKETIPAKYNIETELTEEVKAGANEFNFELKSE